MDSYEATKLFGHEAIKLASAHGPWGAFALQGGTRPPGGSGAWVGVGMLRGFLVYWLLGFWFLGFGFLVSWYLVS